MRKKSRIVVGIGLIGVCIFAMYQFKASHSAKDNLRQEGIRYYQMGDYENAAECFTLALKERESGSKKIDIAIYYYLADGEEKQKNYASAIAYYEKLLELGEKNADLYMNLALCYSKLSRDEVALKMLKKAVKLEPEKIDGYYYICLLYQKQNKMAKCKVYARQGYQQIKKNERGKKCALLAYYSEHYKEAYSYYEQMKESDSSAGFFMGLCKIALKEYDTAIAILENYEQSSQDITDKDRAEAKTKIIYCYMQNKQYDKVLEIVDEAITMPEQEYQKELLFEKGTALEKNGDFEEAYECFKSYVEQYPEDEKGVRKYDSLAKRNNG